MPAYKQIGVPAVVEDGTNASNKSTAVSNRLLGIPSAAPQTSFVGAVISALYAMAASGGAMIDTVNRKVTVSDDADSVAAFMAAAASGQHGVTFTADDTQSKTPNWTLDDAEELEAIFGADPATLLRLSVFNSGRSPESALNALVGKLAALGIHAIVSISQLTGEIKVGKFANNGAQTTAADDAREESAGETAFVTVEIPEPEIEESTGPVWGL